MTEKLPLFPLNTVLFPGVSVPLHVFEDRYRTLVHQLLRIDDPAQRLFGSVAIREGYEVGDHGGQSLHRVGCVLQLTEVQEHPDGTFDIVAVGRGRLRLESLETSGEFLAGDVAMLAVTDQKAGEGDPLAGRAQTGTSQPPGAALFGQLGGGACHMLPAVTCELFS